MILTICKLIALLGLTADIFGAWFISRGLVRKREEEWRKETGFRYAPNEDYIIGGLSQRIECNVGFIFLLCGFILQGLSSVISVNYLTMALSFWLALILLVFCAVTMIVIYKFAEKYIRKEKAKIICLVVRKSNDCYLYQNSMEIPEADDTKRYLRYLGIKYKEKITKEEAWKLFKHYLPLCK